MANNKFQVCFRIVVGTVALLLLTTEGVKLTTETSAQTATKRRDDGFDIDALFAAFDASGGCAGECLDLGDPGDGDGTEDGDGPEDGDAASDPEDSTDYSEGFAYDESSSPAGDLYLPADGTDWDVTEQEFPPCEEAGTYEYLGDCHDVHYIKAQIRLADLAARTSYQEARKTALGSGDSSGAALAKEARKEEKEAARTQHDTYKAAKQDFNSQTQLAKKTSQLNNVIGRSNEALERHAAIAAAKAGLFIADSYARNDEIEQKKAEKGDGDVDPVAAAAKAAKKADKLSVKSYNNGKFADWKKEFKARHNAWKHAVAKLQRHCLAASPDLCDQVTVDGQTGVCTREDASPEAMGAGAAGGSSCQATNSVLVKLGLDTEYFVPDGFNTPEGCKDDDLTAVFYDLSESCQDEFKKLKMFIGGLETMDEE
jgi:hypothetical protein